MTSRSTGLLLLVTLATIVPGCGGSDDGSSNASATIPTSSIDKAEFVKQANAICKPEKTQLVKEVVHYQVKHINEFSVKVVPNAARTVIRPALEDQIAQIRELGAPEGDAEEIEKFFTSLQNGVDKIIAKKPPTFGEAEAMLQGAAAHARRYGINECQYALVSKKFNARVLNENPGF